MTLPETLEQNLDDPGTTNQRLELVDKKAFLREVYSEWYGLLTEVYHRSPGKGHVEIGSGPGFFKRMVPRIITSEVMRMGDIDVVFSAERMPFGNETLAGIYMVDVLHHIPNPKSFLAEAVRCLRPGGRVGMIEPYNTTWGRFVWQNFHHEAFRPDAGWELAGTGPLSDANGALPWIIFERDRCEFEERFPKLSIVRIQPMMPIAYLLSGGVSMRSLVPGLGYPVIRACERSLGPLARYLGMFAFIEIVRK